MITVSYLSLSLAAIAVLLNCATVAEGNCPDDVPTFYSSSAVKAEVTGKTQKGNTLASLGSIFIM